MTAATILALADAGITTYERVMTMLEEARREGLISAQEQQTRIDRVKNLGTRAGVPVIDPPGSS